MKTDKNLDNRRPTPFLLALLAGSVLCSCASNPPVDLENAVRVYNVFRDGGEVPPREVEGCEFLGSVSASAPSPELSSTVYSDPKELLETIRSRAHRKGADTAFVSLDTRFASPLVLVAAVS